MPALNTLVKRTAGNLYTVDGNLSGSDAFWPTCPLNAIAHNPQLAWVYHNDFFTLTSGEMGLAATLTDSGTAAASAAAAGAATGIIALTCSDGTVADNDEAYLGSETTDYILQASKDIWCEWLIKFTEQNTDDANIMVGMSSTYAANALVDNGAGPAANYSGIVFYKVDGGTVWNCEVSAAASQTTQTSVATRKSGSWQRLGFHATGNTKVDFYIDGVLSCTLTSNLPTAAMGLFVGVKNGDTNNEVLYADYVRTVVLR